MGKIPPETVGDVLDEFYAKIVEGMSREELFDYLKKYPKVFGDANKYVSYLFTEGIVRAKRFEGGSCFVRATGHCGF